MASNWSDLALDARLQKSISSDFNFEKLLPVQKHCIPKIINENKDLVAQAITGSGKTLAFLVPILEKLLSAENKNEDGSSSVFNPSSGLPKIHTVILTPTRELAIQIRNVAEKLAKYIEEFNLLCLSGSSKVKLTKETKGACAKSAELKLIAENKAHVIISTPGRLADLIDFSGDASKSILRKALKNIDFLIIDEADRVLSHNFKEQIDAILPTLAKQRRTSLFSATLEKEQDELLPMLARAGLRNPVKIVVKEKFQIVDEDDKTVEKTSSENAPNLLNSYYLKISRKSVHKKFDFLISFLQSKKKEKCLVFFTTCAQVDYFSKGIKSVCGQYCKVFETHGRAKKNKRESVFEEFTEYSGPCVLVCTDVMARGVDFPNVNWVVQFDIPQNAENFVHRCGRTARAGHKGNSLVFLMENELDYIEFLKINQKVKDLLEFKFEESCWEKILTDCTGSKTLAKLGKMDRRVVELGTRAYVSFVQAYSKHEQNILVKTSDLDFGKLAAAYVLFKVPKMPELKNRDVSNFSSMFGAKILEDIPFKDKSIRKDREKRAEVRKLEYIERRKAFQEGLPENGKFNPLKRRFHGKLGQKPVRQRDLLKQPAGSEGRAPASFTAKDIKLKKQYVPKHAKQWTEKKDKEELRKKRKQERVARKEFKRQKMADTVKSSDS